MKYAVKFPCFYFLHFVFQTKTLIMKKKILLPPAVMVSSIFSLKAQVDKGDLGTGRIFGV